MHSGSKSGMRCVWGGRKAVRNQLYMATVSAIRCNSKIREFHLRLIAAGKKPKVAITACMRKLLTIAIKKFGNPATLKKFHAKGAPLRNIVAM